LALELEVSDSLELKKVGEQYLTDHEQGYTNFTTQSPIARYRYIAHQAHLHITPAYFQQG
jgi:hypothetical protein